MKTKTKALVLALCAVLLVVTTVFATMAYLTSQDSVTNTFTVGNVKITLDEADVDNSTEGENDRDKANSYHLIPGKTYAKDPTVTVEANSEDSYVRMIVKVENYQNLYEAFPYEYDGDGDGKVDPPGSNANYDRFYDGAYGYGFGGTLLVQGLFFDENGNNTWDDSVWEFQHKGASDGTFEFRYVGNDSENPGNGIVVKSDSATVLPALFTKLTVPGWADNDAVALLDDIEITVEAHAIQADGFADADAAWAAFDATN